MEKLIYIAWKREGDDAVDLRKRWIDEVAPAVLDAGVRSLTLNVSDLVDTLGERAFLVMGEGRSIAAEISLWLDCSDDRGPIEALLRPASGRLAGYLVTESIPQAYLDRDWPDGEQSPGVTHFTAFPKPDRVSEEDFFAAWHGVHTPLSFELHPRRWLYVRNSVARALTEGAPPYRAIVEERFRTIEDYTDPKRLFGSKEVVERMVAELSDFADADRMDSVPMSETIFRS